MISKRVLFAALLLLCSSLLSSAANVQAAGWGSIKGRFVYDGAPPKAGPIAVNKDREFCGKFNLRDESLVVNPENRGVANVIVYLYLGRRDTPPTPHPSYEKTADAEVMFSNDKCRFSPRVALLRTTQTLKIANADTVGHNTKIDCFSNAPINPIIPAGSDIEQQFSAQERLPTRVSCSIHPWMTGWLVVKNNPYFAVTDENGAFEIKNLPAGKWTLQVWQEKSGYVKEVKKGGKATKWKKGRFKITVKDGQTENMGDLLVSPKLFKDR